jgi:hypothetical protein
MPIPWLTVLQSVPWSDVVRNAPKVAAGAKKLWDNVAHKGAAAQDPADTTSTVEAEPTLLSLRADVMALRAASMRLQQQLAESSALVSELAEQNTQLIAGMDALRRKQKRMLWALWVVAAVALVALRLAFA